jgi:hypothetical protein
MAAETPSAAAKANASARADRWQARQAARTIARAKRISATIPNWVWLNTVDSTSGVMASANGKPLIETACSNSQIAPDNSVIARPIQAR